MYVDFVSMFIYWSDWQDECDCLNDDLFLKALLAERNGPMLSEHLKPGSTPG
jgi:hypothetical protein